MQWGVPRDLQSPLGLGPPPPMVDPAQTLMSAPVAPLAKAMAPVVQTPMAEAVKRDRPSFFGRNGNAWTILGALGDALATVGGAPAVVIPNLLRQRQEQEERDREFEREERRFQRDRNRPIRTEVGDDWVEIDPTTGQSRVLYRGTPRRTPTEFERTLEAAGYTPGSPEWTERMRRRVENQLNPMQAIDTVDEFGNTIRQYVRPGSFGGQQAPPEMLPELPPGAVPIPADGGASPAGSRTFPGGF